MYKQTPVKPFTWIIRMDVHPQWVADGGTISDADAIDMLSQRFGWADVNNELAACVLSAPGATRIAHEQGWNQNTKYSSEGRKQVRAELEREAPVAYSPTRFSIERHVRDLLAQAERINDDALVEGLTILKDVIAGNTPVSDINHLPGVEASADEEE